MSTKITISTEPVLPPECDGSCLDCMSLGDYGKSRTVQSHRESCDIPSIIAKFKRTGQLPTLRANASLLAQYGDFTDVPTFQDAQNRLSLLMLLLMLFLLRFVSGLLTILLLF